jgi:hypothetical protein
VLKNPFKICPQEWKKKDALQRLCMMRALRPDRMTYAVQTFVEEKLGPKYVENRSVEFSKSFEESGDGRWDPKRACSGYNFVAKSYPNNSQTDYIISLLTYIHFCI